MSILLKAITLEQASKIIPGQPHVGTVRRWCNRGTNGVVLKSFKCGRKRCTTLADLEEFMTQNTGANYKAPLFDRHKDAESQLDALGV